MERMNHLRIPSGSRSDSGIDGGCSSSLDSATSLTATNYDTHSNNKTLSVGSEKDGGDSLSSISNIKSENPTLSKNNSESTFDCQSPVSLEDDWSRIESNSTANKPMTNVSHSQVKVKNENNTADERDRFSPVEFPAELQTDEGYDNSEDNNKLFRKAAENPERGKLSSKEEKQRQNEEIVIMESSSVSSETGSWESVFPQRANAEIKESCKTFLNNERSSCIQSSSRNSFSDDLVNQKMMVTSNQSSFDKPSSNSDKATTPISVSKPTASLGACFIDASTLLDEGEIAYNSFSSQVSEHAARNKTPITDEDPFQRQSYNNSAPLNDVWTKSEPIQRLESFHKDFQLCKVNKSVDSDDQISVRIPNLSDEQKLNKRDSDHNVPFDIKDQFSLNNLSRPVSLSMLNDVSRDTTKIDDKDANERQEQERKQGNFLFQNSIQQFSGHTMSPKIPYCEDNHSDFSLPSVYSGSSDPYNDCASTFDTSSQYSSNYGDAHDYGESNKYSRNVLSETETVIFPDTPHNSIIHVNLSRNSIAPSDSAIASLSSSEGYGAPLSRRRSHRDDDGVPIVSGGVSAKDFTPRQSDSPIHARRKDDICPIISQGMSPADFEKPKCDSPVVRRKIDDCPIISLGISPEVLGTTKAKCDSPSVRRRSDDCPIISLGSSSVDFDANKPKCDSPSVRRKTEACPIISLGMTPKDFEDNKIKTVERPKTAVTSSWVVDMSDCNNKNKRRCSESSTSSSIDNLGKLADTSLDRNSSASSHKSLGFYVSLNDMKPPKLGEEILSKSLNYKPNFEQKKKATGFYVDLSNDNSLTGTPPPTKNTETPPINNDKKNIFSMFIDFGEDKKINAKKDSMSKLSSSLPNRSNIIDIRPEDNGITNGSKNHYVFNETDSPVLARRNHSTIMAAGDVKRHSWNTSKDDNPKPSHPEHKRSVSVSEKGIMNIIDKIPLISKTSSMSIDTPNSPFDDITCSKSLSSYSNNSLTSHSSPGASDIPEVMTKSAKRRQRDAKINETFDKSSQGSLTDGILSKNSSPTSTTTDTEDVTFQNENEEYARSAFMETIPETKEATSPKKVEKVVISGPVSGKAHTMETLQATIEKQKQLLDTVTEEVQMSSFVKLSDMDKPMQKFELHHSESMSKSMGSRIGKLFDANKPGNRNSWHSMTRSAGTHFSNLVSSVENLRSLSRIFPHLSKELSNSLPTDFEMESTNRSPIDYAADLIHSDLSTSSATSSFSRSGMDSADEFSLSCRQPRRLGEDLLKMFLQEIATDVTIEVNGRRMKAHKCILRSRCQYFAAILAGGWVESAGNVISLSGYSYGSVHFALCHIYSGASHPPEGISLMELAALADLLGLEGLKEVTAHALKTNYCHNFHKPCSGCIEGILQVFPVALNQGLDDLYRKCLRWVCKHYMKVWTSRTFSQLPADLIGRCKQHIIAYMTSETVLQTVLDCDHLLALLAPCRWAVGVEATVRDIIDAGQCYVSDHFASLLASDAFLSLGQGQGWNISRLENVLLQTGSTLSADQACRSYQRVTRLNAVLNAKVIKMSNLTFNDNGDINEYNVDEADEEMDWNPEFIRLVSAITSAVEQCLIRQCSRAMKISQWQRMDLELRKKIQKLACLSDPAERRPRSAPKPVTYTPVVPTNRVHDLYQVKLAIQAHSKRSSDHQSYKATTQTQTNHERTNARSNERPNNEQKHVERSATSGKVSKSSSKAQVPDLISTIKPKNSELRKPERVTASQIYRRSISETTNNRPTKDKAVDASAQDKPKISEIKSRYLEPKRQRNVLQNQTNLPLKGKTLSSSDSSRTTSPVIVNRRKHSNITNKQKVINESITMSRDSLASPAKTAKTNKINTSNSNEYELSVDSLAESMRSSMRTDKTMSQESLIKAKDNNLRASLSRSNPMINKENHHLSVNKSHQLIKPINNKVNKTKSLSSQAPSINSSTPSSVTLKSRLSSTSSVSSPRSSYKGRQMVPTTTEQNKADAKKSFLSARSKEILAKKEALKHSESTKSVPMIIKEKSIPVNKSSSTSSILNRRTINVPTTLHLRRTAKLPENLTTTIAKQQQQHPQHSLMNPTKSSYLKSVSQNYKTNNVNNKEKLEKKMKTTNQKSTTKIEHDAYSTDDNEHHHHQTLNDKNDINNETSVSKPIRIESKLERSSTFCKESSDIPTSELQIID